MYNKKGDKERKTERRKKGKQKKDKIKNMCFWIFRSWCNSSRRHQPIPKPKLKTQAVYKHTKSAFETVRPGDKCMVAWGRHGGRWRRSIVLCAEISNTGKRAVRVCRTLKKCKVTEWIYENEKTRIAWTAPKFYGLHSPIRVGHDVDVKAESRNEWYNATVLEILPNHRYRVQYKGSHPDQEEVVYQTRLAPSNFYTDSICVRNCIELFEREKQQNREKCLTQIFYDL